ncbi:hypothetical protein A1A1_16485 [Planococcus antarcticus DSM 14505]|uniref:DUF4825 domain-containing protein n=1 Tax=Planococcus antarcticus DSM 14505 TaxID=1185653 RepID=A0AA87IIK3_9BACL|nr:DUF4825 domain-containing protein [Planococcus antarcticus]EIM05380.1 hypothetical protein A1A1_16485 [Planococcus antarcticus DSM 14505]
MNTKNKVILFLLIIGFSLFGVIQGIVLPNIKQDEAQYVKEQQEPLTHNFEASLPYKSKYMGNASNLFNLFHSLPLSHVEKTFQLDSEMLSAKVIYNERISDIGIEKVERSVVYNATAAFALIDNLEEVQFSFLDQNYQVLRSGIQAEYEVPLSELAEVEVWEKEVQLELKDPNRVRSFLE